MDVRLSVLAVVLLASPTWAQSEGESSGSDGPIFGALEDGDRLRLDAVTLIWENDGQFFEPFSDSDRWYTNGIELDFSFNKPWPGFASKLLPNWERYEDPKEAGGLVVGQLIFTPEDIEREDLIEDDRPYAGYLYTGLYFQRSDRYRMDHIELDVGVVGEWAGAEAAQEFVHSILPNQLDPSGWGNQLANELTINLTYEHRWRTPRLEILDFELDGIVGAGFQAGTVRTGLNAHATARLGYNLPDDFGPSSIAGFRDATGTWEENFGIYGFARVEGEAVARDIFLDGNTFANSHSVAKEELVGSIRIGVMLHYHWFETGWYSTWETERFELQPEGHSYGAWYIGGRFTY